MEMIAQQPSNVVPLRPEMEQPEPLGNVQEGGFTIERKKRMFEDAEDAHCKMRELAFRDEDFYHNFDDDQWTTKEKVKLADRGQPTYTHNRIKRKVNFLMGMEQRGRTDPKALPRKPRMEMMAEVATDVLVAIDDMTKFDQTATEGFFGLLVHGLIACEDRWDEAEGEIATDDIAYEDFFGDPHSKKHDYSDARYLGYTKWMDLEDAKALYTTEEQQEYLQAAIDKERISFAGYDDRPYQLWASHSDNRKRVRIITMYYRDAKNSWRLSHFCGSGDLYDVPSPWLCAKGRPDCGITAERLYIDRENRAYGVVRDMIGPQKEDNHYRAKIWHHANDRRFYYSDGAFGDADRDGNSAIAAAKRELAKVDGAVRVNAGMRQGEDWGFLPSGDQVSMLTNLLQGADQELNRQGPNSGLQGRGASTQSGRSRMVQQEAGMIEENNVFDRLTEWKRRSFVRKFNLARQFWRDEMFIRVTDEETGPRFVGLNERVMTPQGFVAVKNDMSKLDVDIILDEMPDVATIQQEQFETISNLLGSGVPPQYLAALIKTSSLRDKDKLIESIMGPQEPDPMAAQAAALEMTQKEANVRKTHAETDKIAAETIHERASAAVDMTKATLGAV